MKHLIREGWRRAYVHFLLAGLIFVIFSLSEGLGILDWDKEVAYLEYIHQSFRSFDAAPLIRWNTPREFIHYPAISHTGSFVGNPETLLFSPFIPLLLFLSPVGFVKVFVFLHFLIGLAGVIGLGRRLKWQPLQVRVFACLILCSPIVIQHLAIGYTPWINLFFFPWLTFFLLGGRWPVRVVGVGFVLSLILLQGGIHPFLLLSGFFVLYSVFRAIRGQTWRDLIQAPLVAFVVFFFSAARILPTVQAFWNYRQDVGVGYDLSGFLFWALTPPVFSPGWKEYFIGKPWEGVPAWDGGIYWGPALLLFVIVTAKYRKFGGQTSTSPESRRDFESILFASLILLGLSFKSFLPWLVEGFRSVSPIPFVEGVERYPYRLMIPAFMGLSVLAAQNAQPTWDWLSRGLTAVVDWLWPTRPLRTWIVGFAALACLAWLTLGGTWLLQRPIQAAMNVVVRDIYQGNSLEWIPWVMESRSFVPVEHYLGVAQVRYQQMQFVLAGSGLMFLSLWWICRHQSRVHSSLRKFSPVFLELMLLLPLLYASLIWLGKAIESPAEDYAHSARSFLKVVVSGQASSEAEFEVRATPESLTVHSDSSGKGAPFVVEGLIADDKNWITVRTGNAVLETDQRGLLVTPLDDDPVALGMNPWSYPYPLYVSLAAWVILAGLCLVYGLRFNPGSGPELE